MKVTVVTAKNTVHTTKILGKLLRRVSPTSWVGNVPDRVIKALCDKLQGMSYSLIIHQNSETKVLTFGTKETKINEEKQKIIGKLNGRFDL